MSYHSFLNENGDEYGSFEVFYDTSGKGPWSDEPRNFDSDGEPIKPGWYWAAGFPGCVWDGEPNGPFDTKQEAIDDARNA